MPLDLFKPELSITPPDGAAGPRLWVRRLAVWHEPGAVPVRDVRLRPGLNIIWSPDDEEMGHGSGKTLFCRLLRYCLGEDRFAPESQRTTIGAAFPDGIVGAEIMLDGVCWSIARPLGVRRRHVALTNGSLDDIVSGEGPSTGLDPFLDAVEEAFLPGDVAALVPGVRPGHRSWPIALAWLTRDQECRFDHVLEWRSAASDSESAARGLNRTQTLDALRAFVQTITPEEVAKRAEIDALVKNHERLELEIGHRLWEIERIRKRLVAELNLAEEMTEGNLAIEVLRQAAQTRLAAASKVPSEVSTKDIKAARSAHEKAKAEVSDIERRLERLDGQIPLIKDVVKRIEEEYPTVKYRADQADKPLCPICEVPLDQILLSKCDLSHKLPDAEAIRKRLQKNREDLASETARLNAALSEQTSAKQELALTGQKAERLEKQLRNLESARDNREDAWYAARRCADDVTRLGKLIDRQETERSQLRALGSNIEQERERVGAFRDRQAQAFGKLSEKFDAIMRRLVGDTAEGRVALAGNDRLDLKVRIGGDRSTAAIDSLKVLAFDLAALCRSMEGTARIPAFLMHDSPREADLGRSIYHRCSNSHFILKTSVPVRCSNTL